MRYYHRDVLISVIFGTLCAAGCSIDRKETASAVSKDRYVVSTNVNAGVGHPGVAPSIPIGCPIAAAQRILGEPGPANPNWLLTNGVVALTQYYEKDGFFLAVTTTGETVVAVDILKSPKPGTERDSAR
jgi:hypothetical protein